MSVRRYICGDLTDREKQPERIDVERNILPERDALREDEVEQEEIQSRTDGVRHRALDEVQEAQIPELFELELQYLFRRGVQTVDFLPRQAKRFDELDIPKRFCRRARERGRLGHDDRLDLLDALGERKRDAANNEDHPDKNHRYDPEHRRRVDEHEEQDDGRDQDDIDRVLDQFFRILTRLLQFAERLAAAFVFKHGVRERERMLHAFAIHIRATPLADGVQVIVLEIFGDTGNQRSTDECQEEHDRPAEKFRSRQFVKTQRVVVDDPLKDDRFDERERLIDGRQNDDQDRQALVFPQVREENLHVRLCLWRRHIHSRPEVRGTDIVAAGRFDIEEQLHLVRRDDLHEVQDAERLFLLHAPHVELFFKFCIVEFHKHFFHFSFLFVHFRCEVFWCDRFAAFNERRKIALLA